MKIKKPYSIIFAGKKIETKILKAQSVEKYLLLKDSELNYYLYKVRTKESILLTDENTVEWFVLYGLADVESVETIKELYNKQN